MTNTESKIMEMLQMQDEMNLLVHPHWRSQDFDWHIAAMVEAIEFLDHGQWKWWKHQASDIPQMKLELVDIWHFMISSLMSDMDNKIAVTKMLSELVGIAFEGDEPIKNVVSRFVGELGMNKRFDINAFFHLASLVNLSFDELYSFYIGKNALNTFRQHNGYKDGTYKKEWNGKEDNVVLFSIMEKLSADTENFKEVLYSLLEKEYSLVS